MNPYLAPPDPADEQGPDGINAWYDVWIDDDGPPGSYLGFLDDNPSVALIKTAMRQALEDLLSGQTRRPPNLRNPSGDVDLLVKVAILRVGHQRNGAVACGWGPAGADPELLLPLGDLAAIAAARLPEQPVGGSA